MSVRAFKQARNAIADGYLAKKRASEATLGRTREYLHGTGTDFPSLPTARADYQEAYTAHTDFLGHAQNTHQDALDQAAQTHLNPKQFARQNLHGGATLGLVVQDRIRAGK